MESLFCCGEAEETFGPISCRFIEPDLQRLFKRRPNGVAFVCLVMRAAPLLPMGRTDLAATHASGPPPGPPPAQLHDSITALLSPMPIFKSRDGPFKSFGSSNTSQKNVSSIGK